MNIQNPVIYIEEPNRKKLLDGLRKIASMTDADFSGKNKEALWEVASKNGYDSNLEYVIDRVKRIDDDTKLVEKFLQEWLHGDAYWNAYSYTKLENDNGQIIVLSVVLVNID